MAHSTEIGKLKDELRSLTEQMEASLDVDKKSFIDQFVTKLDDFEELPAKEKSYLIEILEKKAVEFNSDHPRSSAVLREIIDQLAKIGV